jgi:MoxR-like ATPase
VTIGGKTHALPEPFFVMATQNPLEQEGTYPLPEAQTDRFLFKLVLGYPGVDEELEMLHRWGGVSKTPALVSVSSGAELLERRGNIDSIHVAPAIERYIVDLIQRSRELASGDVDSRVLDYGSSPRGTLALYQSARALAWLRGMDHVAPSIVQELLPDVLRHRIALTYESQAAGSTVEKVVSEIIDSVAVP